MSEIQPAYRQREENMRNAVLIAVLMLSASPALCADLLVPSVYPEINYAIDEASDGDRIIVEPNTYIEDIYIWKKNIVLTSTDPNDPAVVAATIIKGTGYDSVVTFFNSEATLSGFTITNGSHTYGGGINCDGGSPTIKSCIIKNNLARHFGGGIYCDDGSSTIINCTIVDNMSEFSDGGGIFCDDDCTIINCSINGNTANKDGGGIYCRGDELTITNCTFSGNSTKRYGGAVSFYHFTANARITNSTLSSNLAEDKGGGIFGPYDDELILTNSILWGNTDKSGTGESAQITYYTTPFVTYSCIQDDDPNDSNVPFDGTNNHNIDDYPMFVRDPNDGGDGWGVGDNDDFGDLHLRLGSPCVQAGDPNFFALPDYGDIDGQPRILGGRVDIGADEYAPSIVVTRPAGGEVWAARSGHHINWSSYGIPTTVDVLYSDNNGTDWVTIEENAANTGDYYWHLPRIRYSDKCLVSVVPSAADANVLCVESGAFTIQRYPRRLAVPRWRRSFRGWRRPRPRRKIGPEIGCVKWYLETDGPVSSAAAVSLSNKVHVGCEDGKLYTLNPNGEEFWTYDTNSPLIASPAVGYYGMVYAASEAGKLYAINLNGRLMWTHNTNSPIYSTPVVAPNGDIYVCSQDGSLEALGPDGSELWTFETDGFGVSAGAIFATPAIDAYGMIYVAGLYDPNLYAVNPDDGSLEWACNFEFPVDPCDPSKGTVAGWPFAAPALALDGTIYQSLLYDTNLYAIDSDDGNIMWSTDLADPCSGWFGPEYAEEYQGSYCWSDPVFGPDGTIYVSFDDPYLRAINPNGSIKWVKRLGDIGGFTLAVGDDGLVYAASDDTHLYVVGPDGQEVSLFQGDGWLSYPVIAGHRRILISDANDKLWSIGRWGCQGNYDLNGDSADFAGKTFKKGLKP